MSIMVETELDRPHTWEWILFVLALLVQQNAFVSLPILMSDTPLAEMRDFDNPLNRIAVISTLLCIAPLCILHRRDLLQMARMNKLTVLFIGIIVASTLWSIHPGITLRRSASYLVSVLLAALLPMRFGIHRAMKVLSLSFAVSAAGSLAFILLAPQFGIMQEGDLAGSWQGVFCTKEHLGSVMAVAIFVEIFLLVQDAEHRVWRYLLLTLYALLLVFSQSRTALLTAIGYGVGACVFLLWRRDRRIGSLGLAIMGVSLVALLGVASVEPRLLFDMLGKDATLTGRTQLWPLVLELVDKRPLLGWGYRAMWQSADPLTTYIDSVVGFIVPSSHNAFLEVALELGWTGLSVALLLLIAGFRRGAQCLARGYTTLGWFSIMFIVGIVLAGFTTETIGQNQGIEWIVFTLLFFACAITTERGSTPGKNYWDVGPVAYPPSSRALTLHHASAVKAPHP